MNVLGAEAELCEQRPRVLGPHRRATREAFEQRLVALVRAALLLQGADHRPPADEARSRGERHLAEEHREERRLAAAVAARDEHAVAGAEQEIDRPEPEAAPHGDRALERRDPVAGPLACLEPELQLPGLVRLVRTA